MVDWTGFAARALATPEQWFEHRPPGDAPMSLSVGTRLGPYEILAAIGAGGMGEVYKARDTRLGRTVAIKVLPDGLAADPERRRRFEQEARAVSALNHPHICVLHDIGNHEGTDYLVMEHLEGETLAQQLRNGPLPLDQALSLAADTADALSAAHAKHIVHRDLKPGNIMVTKGGAKLLDFGLAKLRISREDVATAPSSVATQEPMTSPSTVLGTVPYMAPEQLEGKPVDGRTDLFGFGCVLYEMLTGRRAFAGETEASIISAIMSSEPPPVSTLQPVTPPLLDHLVRRCLAKDPDARWQSASDVADQLRWLNEHSGTGARLPARTRRRTGLLATAVVSVVTAGIVLGVAVGLRLHGTPSTGAVTRLSLDVRPADEVTAGGDFAPWVGGSRTAMEWTPDGTAILFLGRRRNVQQIYVRRLDATEARPLAGTEGAMLFAISPDSQSVAFWEGKDRTIKKVALAGGPALSVTSYMYRPVGLAWDSHGTLYLRKRQDDLETGTGRTVVRGDGTGPDCGPARPAADPAWGARAGLHSGQVLLWHR